MLIQRLIDLRFKQENIKWLWHRRCHWGWIDWLGRIFFQVWLWGVEEVTVSRSLTGQLNQTPHLFKNSPHFIGFRYFSAPSYRCGYCRALDLAPHHRTVEISSLRGIFSLFSLLRKPRRRAPTHSVSPSCFIFCLSTLSLFSCED